MLLASYKGTRPGLQGAANRLIRWRLRGPYSHTEVVFEPGDDVGHLMPDGTCAATPDGLWCASSVAAERLPVWSPRRAGKVGGGRFKRIALDPARWDVIPLPGNARQAAFKATYLQGARYDWALISSFLAWVIPQSLTRRTCSELAAELAGFDDAWRFDPCTLHAAVQQINHKPNPQ